MVNKTKKGFTIVELVIVIAVIAILAAVLIPTFSNLINKANESADTMLVKNLNTALSVDVEKHTTMSAALEAALVNGGYDVATITTKNKGTKILWDSKNDCFVYVDKNGKVQYIPESTKTAGFEKAENWELFEICDEVPALANQKYSIYLTGTEATGEVKVCVGFDAGNNKGITKVTYARASGDTRDIVLYTNSVATTVEVNAPSDNVTHYGVAGNGSILAVKGSSYHEAGKIIGTLTVESGHVQVESGAEVASIIAAVKTSTDTSVTAPPTVTATNGATVGTIVVNDASAEIKVQSGATVAEVAPGTGVTLDTTKVTGITPSETSIDTTKANDFAGGLGTEASPYLISTVEQFKSIQSGTGTSAAEMKYYMIINDLTFVEADGAPGTTHGFTAYHPEKANYINLNGQGHSLYFGSEAVLFDYVYKSTISNLSINEMKFSIIGEAYSVTMDNMKTYGDVEWSGGNQGIFVIFASGTLTFNNCDNYATINSSGDETAYNSVYVGYRYRASLGKVTLNFNNCNNYGSLTSGKASMFAANLSQGTTNLNINNCNNYGVIRATYMGYTPNCFCSVAESNAKSIIVNGTTVDLNTTFSQGFYHGPNDTVVLSKNEDGTLTFTKSSNTNVSYYVVSVGLYVTLEEGGSNRFYVTERIDANGSDNYTTTLKVLSFVDSTWLNNNSGAQIGELAGNTTYTMNDIIYYFMNETGCTLNGNVKTPGMISVSAYDANGNLISSASIN